MEGLENQKGQEEVTLLDTNALIRLSYEPEKLSRAAASAIRRAKIGGGIAIAAISLWELAWVIAHGGLKISSTVEVAIEEISSRFAVRPITAKIAALATQFGSDYPKDPCDRLIGATALAEGMLLITSDTRLRECKQLRTLW
jgi:PIN domain nuclease of toxin-antitoxin system